MKKLILLFTLLSGIFTSCKTDFELNAPYKETMVVYGLLNVNDTVQYIRISKGFLGDDNALVMAQQADSFNYGNVLQVQLDEVVSGNVVNTFPLERVDSIPKDEGLFAYPFQVYYRLRNQQLNSSSFYKLTVKNIQTGTVATSLTRIVHDVTQIVNPSIADADFAGNGQFSIKFSPVSNGRVYDAVIRFHYTEDSAGFISYHQVDWNFPDQFVSTNSEIIFPYFRPDFYVLLARSIPVKAGVIRSVGNASMGYPAIEFRIIAGTEDLHTYQQLNSPSNSSLQDPPLFTTVDNGIGLFTSRMIRSIYKNLNARSLDSLQNGSQTKDLF